VIRFVNADCVRRALPPQEGEVGSAIELEKDVAHEQSRSGVTRKGLWLL